MPSFTRERQRRFLAHFAASGDVAGSARAAGVAIDRVETLRRVNPQFRERWDAAVERGYEAVQLRLLADVALFRVAADGALVERTDADFDRTLAIRLVTDWHRHRSAAAKSGRSARTPDWGEVETYFIKRMKLLGVRLGEGDGGDGGEGGGEERGAGGGDGA